MKRTQVWMVLAVAALLLAHAPVHAVEGAIGGVQLGATGALAPLERYSRNGFEVAPWAGYMFNNYLGAMGTFHWIGIPSRDAPDRFQDDWQWVIGATVGPRIALPLGGIELWGMGQGGLYTGLSPHSAISDTSWAFTTGGGANMAFTENFSFGAFVTYNRLYQRVHHVGDVRFAVGGINLVFKLPQPTAIMPSSSGGAPPPK